MAGVLGMILAGGEGSRLRPLTESRSKPAVPFGGSYRLIDFALNNFINADLMRIYVLTQFKSQSLYQHMRKGWNLTGITDRFIDPIPAQMRDGKRWYEGTADAIYQNVRFVELANPEHVCIFGSDHIYKMDIRQMLDFHKRSEAKLTVSALRMPLEEASEFGVIEVDEAGKMIGFEEKPENPKSIPGHPDMALVSMGNYIFEAESLCKELRLDAENENSSHDFGKDIIPKMFPEGGVYVYDFSTNKISGEKDTTYWRDVGTIDSYWAAHMDLLHEDPEFSLYNRKWPLHTYYPPLPPATFVDAEHEKIKVTDSLIAGGSYVRGSSIFKSVLGFRSNIAAGSIVSESVILGDVKIGAGCTIKRAIIDKNVEIAPGTVIGEDLELDAKRFHVSPGGIVVIKKGQKLDSRMRNIDVWFPVSEVQGLIKSGGLADVAKALPKALQELGKDVAITLPGYQKLPNKDQYEFVLATELEHWPHTPYQVKKTHLDGVEVYVIECDRYFDRPELYAEHNRAYADNGERFGFFAAASLDVLPKLGIKPAIIHANDWHTGLIPFLLKTRYAEDERFHGTKSVLTVHNAIFKGIFSYSQLEIIPELHLSGMEFLQYGDGWVSTLRAGIAFADKINAVSPNYAAELVTPLGSHGLVDDFVHRAKDLHGIVNGCDYSEWNPSHDEYLPKHYSDDLESMLAGKLASKTALQKELGLPEREVPMIGMVCRLTHQKGFHYILPILDKFLKNDVQVVIIGTGEPQIASHLNDLAEEFSDKLAFVEAYSNRFAHLVEAGSDFFLMPSEFEACGLNQIYSMAYGTLPIVRKVGGLKDTVIDFDDDPNNATGFGFVEPCHDALLIVLQRALLFYLQHPEQMHEMQLRSMRKDFSWTESAKEYVKMYDLALEAN